MTDLKYDVIELGWRLLRSKEIVGHGNFENWASTTFSIHERTAQNYLNAAKNAGLTAKSKSETVSLLREKDKFKNKLLTDLYKSPKSKKETLLLPNPGNSVDKENSAARAAKAFQRIDDVLSETKILRCKFSAENTATLVTTLSEWLQVLTQRKIVLGEPV
jgi:hypothetical protein